MCCNALTRQKKKVVSDSWKCKDLRGWETSALMLLVHHFLLTKEGLYVKTHLKSATLWCPNCLKIHNWQQLLSRKHCLLRGTCVMFGCTCAELCLWFLGKKRRNLAQSPKGQCTTFFREWWDMTVRIRSQATRRPRKQGKILVMFCTNVELLRKVASQTSVSLWWE